MGRRFPEFCTLRAACRVSVRASPFATGDGRVASYQAAIDSVGAQHYTHWPFMVEVLNKWLETNQDFVRDPLGFVASNPPLTPPPTTRNDSSTTTPTQDSAGRTATLTSGHPRTQSSPTVVDDPALSPSCNTEASTRNAGSSPAASTTGTEPNNRDNPPTSLKGGSVPIPIQKTLPLSWIDTLRFPPVLGSLGNLATKTSWFKFFFLTSSYERWWDTLRKTFAFRSR